MKKHYQMKDLAALSGLSTDTIRFYEKRKLLQKTFRGDNNYRYFDENMLKRIIFIKRCRALDLSLNEIERLIELEQNPHQSCDEVNQMIDLHIDQTLEKIKELEKFKLQLQSLRASCNQSNQIIDCAILKRLEA